MHVSRSIRGPRVVELLHDRTEALGVCPAIKSKHDAAAGKNAAKKFIANCKGGNHREGMLL